MAKKNKKKMKELDEEFVARFERNQLDYDTEWFRHHENHLRVVWWYLDQHGERTGLAHVRHHVAVYHRRNGAGMQYHATITEFWARLVWSKMRAGDSLEDFAAFIEAHPELREYGLMFRYYSGLAITSDTAHKRYVPPNLKVIL